MRLWLLTILACLWLVNSACAEMHLPKKAPLVPPIPRDLECVIRVTVTPKVVGILYTARNGVEYVAVQLDRNADKRVDLVLFYPRVGPAQYRPFPTVYFIDYNLDGRLDVEYRDTVGDGLCQHFEYVLLKKGAP